MKNILSYKSAKFLAISSAALLSVSTYGATTFITNDTNPKTLASNESDGAALGSASLASPTTALSLSADDGGGDITLTSTAFTGANNLNIDGDSLGNGNDKWGANQSWTFQFDQEISFDSISMFTLNETMSLQSSAWAGEADTSGTGWTFNGTSGTFSLLSSAGPTFTYDFTSAGFIVPENTNIRFGFFGSANGGEQMASFTISPTATPIPEPSSTMLAGFGVLMLGMLRRRK